MDFVFLYNLTHNFLHVPKLEVDQNVGILAMCALVPAALGKSRARQAAQDCVAASLPAMKLTRDKR